MRPERVKRIARELLAKYPDRFTANFEENKKVLSTIAHIPSSRLRNSIAGYTTRLVSISEMRSATANKK